VGANAEWSERLLAALAAHTLGMAPVRATRTSLRAPPLRLPADQSRSATLEGGKRRPPLAGTRPVDPHPTTGGRPPEPGVDMATQNLGARVLGPAAAAGFALAVGALGAYAVERRISTVLRRLERLERLERETEQREALIAYQRHNFDLVMKAAADPTLLPVLNAYEEELSPKTQRQYLFANLLYTHVLQGYRVGVFSRAELYGHLRGIFQSTVMRDYWAATRHHRSSLKEGSEESEIGKMVDALIHDLEEADTDEWWVVGEPPAE
jgi:hypothetical protein